MAFLLARTIRASVLIRALKYPLAQRKQSQKKLLTTPNIYPTSPKKMLGIII